MSNDPEIRIDQLTGLRTILAPARAERPIEFTYERPPAKAEDCPFCEGREDRTPPETWADRPGGGPADGPGWRVRAVPNLYPAVAEASEGRERGRRARRASPPAPTPCGRPPGAPSPTSSPRSPRPGTTR